MVSSCAFMLYWADDEKNAVIGSPCIHFKNTTFPQSLQKIVPDSDIHTGIR